jgi:hypothetical protein
MFHLQVNLPGAFLQGCSCGRVFAQPEAFKNHQNSCLSSKQVLTDILARTKNVLTASKAKKATNLKAWASQSTSNGSGAHDADIAELACAEETHKVRNLLLVVESCYTIRSNTEPGN